MKLVDSENRLHGQPAISEPGRTLYYKHGALHNDNGPAVVTPDRIAHYIEGVLTSEFFLVGGIWVSKARAPVAEPFQEMQRPKKVRKLLTERHTDDGN